MTNKFYQWCAVVAMATLAACGSHKSVTGGADLSGSSVSVNKDEAAQLRFVQQVADQRLYQKNIVSDMSFRIQAGSINQALPGSLHMRRDEVIRLQVFIPLLGSEVGRIEFTPDYVLVVDRLHKEYIKADYGKLDFLRDNGLDFYSLQSLFWNQFLLPGTQRVTEGDLAKFAADLDAKGNTIPVTYGKGKLRFEWQVDKKQSRIQSAEVAYESAAHGRSTLTWTYSDFQSLGVKFFPATQSFTFATTATGSRQQGMITINLSRVGTDSNWESHTTLSSKYKQVEASDVFDKLLRM